MSKTLALDFGCVLRTAGALVALGFFPAVLPAQQVLAGGANLFAPSPHVGRELDAARALPVTSFYATEGLKANADPGTFVRSEPATEYALPPGVTAVRILYHTRTAGNVDAVASAVVLVPYGQAPPGGGWPLLAWSHGTSGVARECAPSRMTSVFYNWESLGVAQLEGTIQDPDFLGSAALAGASDLEDGLDSVLRAKIPVLNGLVAFWVYGVKTVYPELDLKDLLTSRALAIYNASVEDGCSAASGGFCASLHRRNFPSRVEEEQMHPGVPQAASTGQRSDLWALLLVGGGDDILFGESASRKVLHRLCTAGARVQRNVYPGLGDDPVVYGFLRDQLDWIAARFAGEPPPSNCGVIGFQGSIWPWNKRGPSTSRLASADKSCSPILFHRICT
jgi:hypothetical protein